MGGDSAFVLLCRKENVFQDLDKRTLTAEEQAVIDSRVSLLYLQGIPCSKDIYVCICIML